MTWEQRVNGLQTLTTGSISQLAFETLIWDPWWFTEFRQNTYNPEQVILHGGGQGYLAVSENAAKNWDDRTAYLEQTGPPNSWSDDPAPVMGDVILKQVHGDIHKLARFCGVAPLATGTVAASRGWLLVTDNDWFTTEWTGMHGINEATGPDWVFVPSGAFSNVTSNSGGPLGTGTIKNNGDSFTLTSVPGSDGSSAIEVLGIIVEGFRISQIGDTTMTTTPAGSAEGTFTAISGLPITNQSHFRRTVTACGGAIDQISGLATNGTVDNRQMLIWYHGAASGQFSITFRVDTSPTVCNSNLQPILPLALDIDNETGKRCYVTAWEDGSLILQNWGVEETTPSLNEKYTIGSATISEVEQKTYYAVPFCSADFDTAGFGDTVYIFGVLPGGEHIIKSTDGGTTFGSNLGDGSWSTNRVAAFFALSSTEFYAFLNVGATCEIWHTEDGGTSWVQRNTLPLNVEHQTVSRHASGALLIGNSVTGPIQAALLSSAPYDGTYTDVSGSGSGRLPNQVGGPGGGLSSIIWVT